MQNKNNILLNDFLKIVQLVPYDFGRPGETRLGIYYEIKNKINSLKQNQLLPKKIKEILEENASRFDMTAMTIESDEREINEYDWRSPKAAYVKNEIKMNKIGGVWEFLRCVAECISVMNNDRTFLIERIINSRQELCNILYITDEFWKRKDYKSETAKYVFGRAKHFIERDVIEAQNSSVSNDVLAEYKSVFEYVENNPNSWLEGISKLDGVIKRHMGILYDDVKNFTVVNQSEKGFTDAVKRVVNIDRKYTKPGAFIAKKLEKESDK